MLWGTIKIIIRIDEHFTLLGYAYAISQQQQKMKAM